MIIKYCEQTAQKKIREKNKEWNECEKIRVGRE